jgi:hypothetical protein
MEYHLDWHVGCVCLSVITGGNWADGSAGTGNSGVLSAVGGFYVAEGGHDPFDSLSGPVGPRAGGGRKCR